MLRSCVAAWLLALAACNGSADYARQADRTTGLRPGWIPSPNRQHPELFYLTASCRDQASLAAGKDCALRDGHRQIAEHLGPTDLSGRLVEGEYSEQRKTPQGVVYDVWLLVAYPRPTVDCAKARASGRVLIGFECKAESPALCRPDLVGQVEKVLTQQGLAVAPDCLSPDRLHSLLERAERDPAALCEAGVGYALLLNFDVRFAAVEDGAFFAFARGGFRLFDVAGRKAALAHETGDIKGGAYTREAAQLKALDNALAALLAELRARLSAPTR